MNLYSIFHKVYEKGARKKCFECQDFTKKGAKILDLGCGSGIAGMAFKKYFNADVIGVDIKDQRVIPLPFQIIDGKSLPFNDNAFDVVLISFVLHHSSDPIALLKEARRVTRDKILIYEDLSEGVIDDLICKTHGISYNLLFQKNNENGRFLNTHNWQQIFVNLGLKLIFKKRVSHILNPVKKKLFVLEKNLI